MDQDRGRGEADGVGGEGEAGEGLRPEDEPGTGVVAAFGRQLKLVRVAAGLERPELGARLGYSASTIASYEQGRRIPPPKFIDKADEVLGAGGVLKALKEEVARAQYPAFFRDAARLEAGAAALSVYAVHAVPGLLQTEEYARAVFHMQRPLLDDDVIEQRLAARLARQDTTQSTVRVLESRYGIIRSQALTPRESSAFIEKLLGER
ncbi:Scr1 family TA system antitoxin-like transcriptional regulator [Streptomyces mirabilis]|uniref:helix-turn-helix domain-containing protein n=1 Tax=Streptomyces mirabilis TaxID=68239 RepID=UPI00382CF2DF